MTYLRNQFALFKLAVDESDVPTFIEFRTPQLKLIRGFVRRRGPSQTEHRGGIVGAGIAEEARQWRKVIWLPCVFALALSSAAESTK